MGWAGYEEPRLAALYDVENRWARDDDFFLALADLARAPAPEGRLASDMRDPAARAWSTLAEAGFAVEAIHGGWNREPVGAGEGELVVVARLRPSL